jgi:hypothetical protein
VTFQGHNATLVQPRVPVVGGPPLLLPCPALPPFAPDDLAAVRHAFREAPACRLRQAWRSQAEADFAPGVVWTGWRADRLLVLAELTDADIVSPADAASERLWEQGDTFEIFLQAAGRPAYVELHIAPNHRRLQLRYNESVTVDAVRRSGSLAAARQDVTFDSTVWAEPAAQRWFVHAAIPAPLVTDRPGALAGTCWRFSFGRYDYTRGRSEPVISSTSPHAAPDFHRCHEWGTLQFNDTSTAPSQ